jgi:aquaporin Z
MDTKLRSYLIEAVGTYLLVLVGAGTLCTTYLTSFQTVGGATLAVALAEGLVLAGILSWTTLVSPGCCNPAIALSLWLTGQQRWTQALGLIAAQLAGAFLAGCSIRFLFADQVLTDARLGTPHLGAILARDGSLTLASLTTGFLLEAVFTALITLSVLSTLLGSRRSPVGGLVVGLTQVAVILFGFHLTGGAANPARWFGPALWQGSVSGIEAPLAQHLVYWAGPAVGAMLASVVYSRWVASSESP